MSLLKADSQLANMKKELNFTLPQTFATQFTQAEMC